MAESPGDKAINILYKRAGFDHWWDMIDPEIQAEIKDEINAVVNPVPPGVDDCGL